MSRIVRGENAVTASPSVAIRGRALPRPQSTTGGSRGDAMGTARLLLGNDGGISRRRSSKSASEISRASAASPTGAVVVINRSAQEKARSPDKLNLDGRGLELCPRLENEGGLRLLSLKNNRLRALGCMGELSSLIFLDLYGNQLTALEGPLLVGLASLRVLMAGRNAVAHMSGLSAALPRLDVLDVHGNQLAALPGLDNCRRLRVLNAASNQLRALALESVQSLAALAELNLRRNQISRLCDLSCLRTLRRLLLSANRLEDASAFAAAVCGLQELAELSVDENPLFSRSPGLARLWLVGALGGLATLNAAAVSSQERAAATAEDCRELLRKMEPGTPGFVEDGAAVLLEASESCVVTQTPLPPVLLLEGEEQLRSLVARPPPPAAMHGLRALCARDVDAEALALALVWLLRPAAAAAATGGGAVEVGGGGGGLLWGLERLELRGNGIASLSALLPLLALAPSVSSLVLADNPVCASTSSSALLSAVRAVLPRLQLLETTARPEQRDTPRTATHSHTTPPDEILELGIREIVDVTLAQLMMRQTRPGPPHPNQSATAVL